MRVYGGASSSFSSSSMICCHHGQVVGVKSQMDDTLSQKKPTYLAPRKSSRVATNGLVATVAAAASVLLYVVGANAVEIRTQQEEETLSNIPQTLSGECISAKDCKKARIQRPKSKKAESCTTRCLTTCIHGGDRSPGKGTPNVWRPIAVFREGFRSRQYCLVECSDICNLIGDGEDGI